MGSAQSSCPTNDTTISPQQEMSLSDSARGRKSIPKNAAAAGQHFNLSAVTLKDFGTPKPAEEEATSFTHRMLDDDDYDDSSYTTESDDESESDDDSNDGDDQECEERLCILDEARKLKQLANFFLHPETPVKVDGFATAHNFFERPSAPERISREQAEEQDRVFADLKELKKLAMDYRHPELEIKVDGFATARCFFDRPAAPERISEEQAEEQDRIFADLKDLKEEVMKWRHPELEEVKTSSGPERFSQEEAEELLKALKMLSTNYFHPDLPVKVDGVAAARSIFEHPSGPERFSQEDAEELLKSLKMLSSNYFHPELDGAATARCFFDRPSAPEGISEEDAEEQALIAADLKALKQLAIDWRHPELGVASSDPTRCGRDYFSRPSAPERISVEDAEEQALIAADLIALKKVAMDWRHPELGVASSDPTSYGRDYFSRPSAPERVSEEEAEEKDRIFSDLQELKKLAIDWRHPELEVKVDGLATARCFFDRLSAPERISEEDADEQALIAADLKALKQLAIDWRHPELGVAPSDPTRCGRDYFSRPSAPERISKEDAEEQALIAADLKAMKQLAIDWRHPELVVKVDSLAAARCFFDRPSAPERISEEDAEEQALIAADLKAMKQLAIDWRHPELGVAPSDSTRCGRDYFSRPSAPERISEEEAEEQALIVADLKALKQLAIDWRHPELGVAPSDPTRCGRDYFSRPSAPERISEEDAEEKDHIIFDLHALEKLAIDWRHPELGVPHSNPNVFGRDYFHRVSAPGHEAMVHTFPGHIEEDHSHYDDHHHEHEHLDHFGMDEDMDCMFEDMRQELALPKHSVPIIKAIESDEEEGHLSRSPSSVMLYMGEAIND